MASWSDESDHVGYVVRVGDADDYHVEAELSDVVSRLHMHGIRSVSFFGQGATADGYNGNNYISLFWGVIADPIRWLTPEERQELSRLLADGD